jgi:hypothetical protein
MRLTAQRRALLERRTGGLSRPSKLPGWSYSLPAGKACHVGSKLLNIESSVCHDCYAMKGHYRFPNVIDAQQRRLQAVKFSPTWVDDMVELIGSKREKYFRWHDSGDLQSITHLNKIVQVATALPDYYFWLPTLEYLFIKSYRTMVGGFPVNVTVRLSTPIVDQTPPTTNECTSSVVTDALNATCPAPQQGNTCGTCRACWNPAVKHVTYLQH